MARYISIPTYLDSACTQFYRNLKICVLSADQDLDTAIMSGSSNANPKTFGKLANSVRFAAPGCSTRLAATDGVRTLETEAEVKMNNIISRHYPVGMLNDRMSVDDGFNLLLFAPAGTTIYIKNGGSIEFQSITVDNIQGCEIYIKKGSTSKRFCTFKYFTIIPGTTISVDTLYSGEQGSSAAYGNDGRTYCCAYFMLSVLDTWTTLSSNNIDSVGITTCVVTYDNYSKSIFCRAGERYLPSTAQGYTTQVYSTTAYTGYLYTLLPTSTLSDYEVKSEQKDDDNTYPGGGNDENEYPEDGESGKGDFDNTNDPIEFPTLPIWDVQSTGFISLWNPSISQLGMLYSFLWDSDISTTLKKLFNEPMNAIFSLGIIPVDPITQGTRRLTIGHVDTEIDMESIQKQFVTFDFGSIDINEYYGAAWDYSPYTHASIYLPYIGVQSVDIDDIMNCTLTLRYNIDVLTGTTIALLKCVRKGRDNLNAVMYEWQGNCVTQCPITAGNWSQIMASVIQLGAMTGLALSQPVVGAIGSAVGSSAAAEYAQGKNLVNPTMATYGALNVLGSKVHVQRGGRLDMSSGAMSMQKAFIILNRPVSGIPRGWNKYAGYPSLKIKTLGSQKGFVSVGAIKLDGLRATANEITELDTILKAGVII